MLPFAIEVTERQQREAQAAGPPRGGSARPRPEAALEIVDRLDDSPYLHSTRAKLLRRLGRVEDAHAAYEPALELTRRAPERRFLERRLASLS